jgi:hemoglobin-like flavoprotein
MTPGQIALVRQSWQQLEGNAQSVAELFYARLFELDPAVRRLFKSDMRRQGDMLTQVIGLAVSQLHRLDQLAPVVRGLGQRHSGYGVQEHHYATVGAALLDTLAAGLKGAFTAEVKEAWTTTYMLLAEVMKSGGRPPADKAA